MSWRQPAHKTMGWSKNVATQPGLSFPHTLFIVGDAEYGHRQTLTTPVFYMELSELPQRRRGQTRFLLATLQTASS